MADETLFHVDVMTVGGKPIGIEDGSFVLAGALGYENGVVPNSNPNGADGVVRRRVGRSISFKLLFKPGVEVADIAKWKNVQVTGRDLQSGRRVMLPNCCIGTLGQIGAGSVDGTMLVLEPPQWL